MTKNNKNKSCEEKALAKASGNSASGFFQMLFPSTTILSTLPLESKGLLPKEIQHRKNESRICLKKEKAGSEDLFTIRVWRQRVEWKQEGTCPPGRGR